MAKNATTIATTEAEHVTYVLSGCALPSVLCRQHRCVHGFAFRPLVRLWGGFFLLQVHDHLSCGHFAYEISRSSDDNRAASDAVPKILRT